MSIGGSRTRDQSRRHLESYQLREKRICSEDFPNTAWENRNLGARVKDKSHSLIYAKHIFLEKMELNAHRGNMRIEIVKSHLIVFQSFSTKETGETVHTSHIEN